MSPKSGLTVGVISFLNCVPFFHYLKESGYGGNLVPGVPSALNRLLQQGELDVSPSSSFEYALHWRDYLLLPGYSISSINKIESVLFFSPVELSELEGQQIAITGESATSINLLRVILREFEHLEDVADVVFEQPVEELIAQNIPGLLIGDRALKFAVNCPPGIKIYDLGEIWHRNTGLPFVFGLWIVRKDAAVRYANSLTSLTEQLHSSYEKLMSNAFSVAGQYSECSGLSREQIVDYWNCINYRLDEKHLAGLKLFFQLCTKHKLLVENPPLEFFQSVPAGQICS